MEQVWSAQFMVFTRPTPRHEQWRAWYRGDRYVSEIDFPVSALKSMPGITEPQPDWPASASGAESSRLNLK